MLNSRSLMRTQFKEGDLIKVLRHENSWTLCMTKSEPPGLRECPVPELEIYTDPHYAHIFDCLEGKVGLVVYVAKNRLDQSLGYRVLFEGTEVFCKSIVAEKYFELQGNNSNHEHGRYSKV